MAHYSLAITGENVVLLLTWKLNIQDFFVGGGSLCFVLGLCVFLFNYYYLMFHDIMINDIVSISQTKINVMDHPASQR